MFFVNGWTSITEVPRAFVLAANGRPDLADEEETTVADLAKDRRPRQLQAVLKALRQFAILLPSGYTAKGTSSLVSGLQGLKTTHVDLQVGTVGSGTFWDIYTDEEPSNHQITLERQYGIFLGCPVMVDEKEVQDALRVPFPWHTAGSDISPEQEAAVTEGVSELAQAGPGPGRLGRYGGHPKRHVQTHFRPLIAPEGKYANDPKTSVYQRAFEWIRTLIDEEVPLQTVEGWMRELYKELEKNPNPKARITNPATASG